jgi:hypothetical protein
LTTIIVAAVIAPVVAAIGATIITTVVMAIIAAFMLAATGPGRLFRQRDTIGHKQTGYEHCKDANVPIHEKSSYEKALLAKLLCHYAKQTPSFQVAAKRVRR